MNMDSSIVFAKFGLDSIGQEFGYPLSHQERISLRQAIGRSDNLLRLHAQASQEENE